MRYKYVVQGIAADDQTWKIEDAVDAATGEDFQIMLDTIMERVFSQLTNSFALDSPPEVFGCRGPYKITNLTVEALPK